MCSEQELPWRCHPGDPDSPDQLTFVVHPCGTGGPAAESRDVTYGVSAGSELVQGELLRVHVHRPEQPGTSLRTSHRVRTVNS